MNGEGNDFFQELRLIVAIFAVLAPNRHVSADDAAVMVSLAKSLSPVPAGWTGNDPCKWPGVECDGLGRVKSINLSSMFLTGRLPPDLNQLSALTSLNLEMNKLSGALPPLSDLSALEDLNLDGNNFTSVTPNFLAGITNLRTICINDVPSLVPWPFPEEITACSSLVSFSCTRCNLVGPIPDIFGSIPTLETLKLSYNNLTGSLPPSLAQSGIQVLTLNNQLSGLSGRVDVIGKMEQVTQIWLHVNKFTGPIPDLSRSHFLSDLKLRDNLLTGVIPDFFSSLPKLTNVSLQNNMFQGPMPNFPRTVHVDIGNSNSFCHPVPKPCDPQVNVLLEVAKDLGYPLVLADSWKGNDPCEDWDYVACDVTGKISVINLSNHNWIGTISPALGNLTGLRELILHDNQLTGVIPETLTTLPRLQLLDISNNNVSGNIPPFSRNVTVKTEGNPFIGVELPKTSPFVPVFQKPQTWSAQKTEEKKNEKNKKKGDLSHGIIIAIAIAGALQIAAICWVIHNRCNKMRKCKWWAKEKGNNSGNKTPKEKPNTYYEGGNVLIPIEILREVTNNFSDLNVLGRGGFGVVYRGQLYDGTQIAVKRMQSVDMFSSKGVNEFKAEIEVLSKVRHRHLVALHGFCVNRDERLLVYEFMPQGTLGQHLFRHEGNRQPLSWKQRVTIALDVARGVEYLHGLAQQSFIHRDLKPSNILLGDGMRAKVSDFGLVKNAPDGSCSLETKLAGTFGYLAPEYAATGRVSTKVDVYSFGVVLMEMITGRKALDESLPEERVHLVPWFRRQLANREKLKAIIDPCLEPDKETFERMCRVADLAGYCTAREPHQRPDMNHAVNILSPMVEEWVPVSREDEDDDEEDSFGADFRLSLPQALQRWKASEDSSSVSEDMYDSSCNSTTMMLGRLHQGHSNSFRN
ncbi:hypothetical protein DM860_012542 [Cuscuta australis]|uniref:Protein kinase domain-containing protein n=1 Tax=Cuscuta australis TaxID=267555 RepID=A0A328DGS6_9ASTE|nr:hypothetical protein DM860_012542 [Cuscuta australis]